VSSIPRTRALATGVRPMQRWLPRTQRPQTPSALTPSPRLGPGAQLAPAQKRVAAAAQHHPLAASAAQPAAERMSPAAVARVRSQLRRRGAPRSRRRWLSHWWRFSDGTAARHQAGLCPGVDVRSVCSSSALTSILKSWTMLTGSSDQRSATPHLQLAAGTGRQDQPSVVKTVQCRIVPVPAIKQRVLSMRPKSDGDQRGQTARRLLGPRAVLTG
jgi:hypothetical protein